MTTGFSWLTLVLLVPILGAVAILCTPRREAWLIKTFALIAALATGFLVLGLLLNYSQAAATGSPISFKYAENVQWLPQIGASYRLGLDGLSAWFLALNAVVFLLGVVVALVRGVDRPKLFFGLLILTEAATAGVILSTDLLLFYLFWEGMLLPLYFLLSSFGNEKRQRATVKFIGYTVAWYLLMLLAIIYLHTQAGGSFSYDAIAARQTTGQSIITVPGFGWKLLTPDQFAFLAFALAFAIKVPLVPFHTWLPDLYESLPASGLTFFAGIVSKLGIYGFIRYAMTLFPKEMHDFQGLLLALALLSILYGAFMALQEVDIKRIVAYSSISHLGFISLGVFALTVIGLHGAILQVINHGIIIAALFIIMELIEVRTGTRDRSLMSGLEKAMPWMYFLFMITALAALGMPGLNGFAGEFMIMLGAFEASWVLAVIAGIGVVLAGWYMLRLHQGLMHDPLHKGTKEGMTDLRLRERWVLIPLCAAMVALGLFPNIVGQLDQGSVQQYMAASHTQPASAITQPTPLTHEVHA